MLTLLTGKTGSGKSYQAVSQIINSLGENRKVFTNIFINIEDENYHYLDELEVKKFLKFIEDTFKFVDNLDDKKELIKKSIYFDADFYIDEAHLVGFRDKKESILNWATLHRHFNQNIIVITQVPSNLHRDYLAMFHSHIDMIPQKRRLSKDHMGYQEFDGYKGDQYPTKHFKPNPEIFTVYGSGNKELGQSPLVKKIILLFIGLGIILLVIFYMISSMFNRDYANNDNNDTKVVQNSTVIEDKNSSSSVVVADLNQTFEEVFCYTDTGCYYNAIRYTYDTFLKLLKKEYPNYDQKIVAKTNSWRMYKIALKK